MYSNKDLITETVRADYAKITAVFQRRNNSWEEMFMREVWAENYYFHDLPIPTLNDNVLDIGGHIGGFSILVGKMANKVVAYEPIKENVELFKHNIEINGLEDRVKVLQVGVGKDDRSATIYLPNGDNPNTGKGTVADYDIANSDARVIQIWNINDVLNGHRVNFTYLKLDCEGSEYEILPAIDYDRFPKLKYITMEFHESLEKGMELKTLLESKGYAVKLDYSYGAQGRIQARKDGKVFNF